MLYYLSQYLVPYWGPFRLLQSHALLLAGGTFAAALLVWLLLPRVCLAQIVIICVVGVSLEVGFQCNTERS